MNQAPGGGTDYPFVGESPGAGVVLDAYLAYEDGTCAYQLPFELLISGDNVTVRDANAVNIFEGVLSGATLRTWGDREVREWISDPVVFRLVTKDVSDVAVAVLDPRTCNRMPARVKSVRVGLIKMTGNIRFESGYNIDLSGGDPAADRVDGGRFASVVNIDAVPGAGAGRLSGCEEVEVLVRKINRQPPDCGGNFKIEVDPCLRASLPLFVNGNSGESRTAEYSHEDLTPTEAQHALRMTSDCRPCCDCDYFVRTYRGLKRVRNKWKDLAVKAEGVRDVYDSNRERWLASRQCRIDNPARLLLWPDLRCTSSLAGSFCNFTTCCLTDLEIRFTMTKYAGGVAAPWGGGSAVESTISGSPYEGDVRYAPESLNNGQVLRFMLDYANPQDMSTAKMRFNACGCLSTQSLGVTMTVHTAQPAPNPHNGDPCDLPSRDADVPTEVADAWAAAGLSAGNVRAVLTKAVALNPAKPTFNCGC